MAIDTLVVEYNVFIFSSDVTSICLISPIWVKCCRCTCLPSLVILGLVEIEISILIPVLTWIPWENLNSPLRSAICNIFNIRNNDLQSKVSYGWPNTEKKEKKKKNTGTCKALCVSRKRKKYEFIPTPFFLQYYICDWKNIIHDKTTENRIGALLKINYQFRTKSNNFIWFCSARLIFY